MSLADFIPDEIKEGFGRRNLVVGSVLKLKVKDTNPPKEKRFIIVGITDDKLCLATVYINSEVNTTINWSLELQALQIKFEAKDREYLDRDSYIDCSKLITRDYKDLESSITEKPQSIIGELNDEDLGTIKKMIKEAPTIKGKYKKKFGFYPDFVDYC